jgi:uncharacterized protein (TIGR03435 family)
MVRAAAVIVAFVRLVIVPRAQSPVDQPKFDVASVRPNISGDGRFSIAWPKGSFSAINVELRTLVAHAYGITSPFLGRFKVVGGPEQLLAERYDIQARTPETAPEGQHFLMLRSLLAERFNLRVRYESRPTSIYALSLAREDRRLGPNLRASAIDCTAERERARRNGERLIAETAPRDAKGRPICWGMSQPGNPGAMTLTAVGPLSDLVRSIQGLVDRPIVDATALTGMFEWHLIFAYGVKPPRCPIRVYRRSRTARPEAGSAHKSVRCAGDRFRRATDAGLIAG